MPYETGQGGFERANKLGQSTIINNDLVAEELGDFEENKPDPDEVPIEENTTPVEDLDHPTPTPKFVISIDGSRNEPERDDDYPENRIGFIQIAAVLTNLNQVEAQSGHRFVDPRKVKQIADSSLTQFVLPSTNHTYGGASDTHESWRKKTYDIFTDEEREFVPDTTLFEYYHKLLEDSVRYDGGAVLLNRCPNPECDERDLRVPSDGVGQCGGKEGCGTSLYPTDALRVHERVSNHQSNISALTVLMNIIEHLALGAFLEFFAEKDPEFLQHIGFIKDGPLAQFDTGYWIHGPLLRRIHAIYEQQLEQDYARPVIVGVAKGGHFAQHGKRIREKMERNSVLSMDSDYIYDYVATSRSSGQQFGKKTYYGKNFIFRSNSGRVFAMTVPRETNSDGRILHEPAAYPTLRRTTQLLSQVETALYEDSLIPVALANQYASIPVKTGSKTLAEFANRVISGDGMK